MNLSSTIMACDSPSEMLALALLSDNKQAREALGCAGAGIEKGATLNQTLQIRVGTEDDLQFVVGETDSGDTNGTNDANANAKGYRRLVAGEEYQW